MTFLSGRSPTRPTPLARTSSCWTSTSPGWTDGRSSPRSRADAHLKTIPTVILTTSDAAEADILKSYELKANATSASPCRLDDFEDLVQEHPRFWLTGSGCRSRCGADERRARSGSCCSSRTTRATPACSARCSASTDSHETELTHVESIADAEQYLAEHSIDVILLDLGLARCARTGCGPPSPRGGAPVPLVVLTGLRRRDAGRAGLAGRRAGLPHQGPDRDRAALRAAIRYAIERKTHGGGALRRRRSAPRSRSTASATP